MSLKFLFLVLWIATAPFALTTVEASLTLSLIDPEPRLIIDNGTVLDEFLDTVPTLMDIRTFSLTFSMFFSSERNDAAPFSLLLTRIPSSVSDETLSGIESNGFLNSTERNFVLDVTCSDTATVFYTLILTFSPPGAEPEPPTVYAIRFAKECRLPGCAETCDIHGTCEDIVGICHCDENYYGDDCSIEFGYFSETSNTSSSSACIEDHVALFWTIPEESTTRFDWWGIFPNVDDLIFDATTVIYWEYLNSGSKRNGDQPSLSGNATLAASLPQHLIVGLFYNDGYVPFATFPFTFRNWSECRDFSNFDCNTQCQRNGTCADIAATPQDVCSCPSGLFWYDCSLGCSGLTTLTTSNGSFAVGGGRRPLPLGLSGCEWLIAPAQPLTSITLSFDYFDISSTDYVDVYSGANSDGQLIVSLSGPQLLQPLSLNTTSLYIKLRIAYGSQGYSGFQARWSSFFVKVNQVLIVSEFHPGGIVFYVLMSIGIAIFIALLAFLARYKDFWIVRSSNASFLALVVFGAGLGYAAIPQFWGAPSRAACALRFWFPSLGWIIMMGCYLVKSWRIHKIFSNKKTKPVVLTDARLLQYVGVMVLYEVIFLSIWTAVDTPIVVKQTDRLDLDTDYFVCGGTTTLFPILSLFSKVAMMIWGLYLSWKTRHIVELFSESRFIGFAIYAVAFTSVIFVPLLYILPQFNVLWLVLACSGIILVFTLPVIIIFVRLLRFVKKYPNDVSAQQVRNMTLNHNIQRESMRQSRYTTNLSMAHIHKGSSTLSTTDQHTKSITSDNYDTGDSATEPAK